MNDLISRQAAINCFHAWIDSRGDIHEPDEMQEYRAIEALPSVQPEREKGKWLFPYGDKKYKRCSVCERDYYSIPHNSNFCPNCGADMRGET